MELDPERRGRNSGVGTPAQYPRRQGKIRGLFAGHGVEGNVIRSVRFVRDTLTRERHLTVNLAGHSRGSITCYKIAYQLFETYQNTVPVNIFAIDPVPGNNGKINEDMYKQMALRDNVAKSFLMLAESEHRQTFRPYIDERYATRNRGEHKYDTMPGTHGGINMLTGSEHEAAELVLSRALRFLEKHGTLLENRHDILRDDAALRKYSELMTRISEYKARASINPFKSGGLGNLFATSLHVEKHRIVNVAGPKTAFGGANNALVPSPEDRVRKDHHGLGMNTALQQMGQAEPQSQRPIRSFANKEHEKLF